MAWFKYKQVNDNELNMYIRSYIRSFIPGVVISND